MFSIDEMPDYYAAEAGEGAGTAWARRASAGC